VQSLHDEVRQFCSRHRLRLDTDLGQHFLIDEGILRAIVEAADITPDEQIVEIGPGIGILTRELLRAQARVTAIELDDRLLPLLREFTGAPQSLTIIQGNALQVPLPETPYAMVANIPYHITSPLFRHAFLESPVHPRAMTLLIQREVAEKICDADDRGILSIVVQLFGVPSIVTHVPPSAFLPPPKVESSVLHVACFPKPRATPEETERILRLTKIAFAQRRKMLRNSIGSLPQGMELLAQAGIEPVRRPQTLTMEEWLALARSQRA